jgi:hypothetical protein
MTATVGSMTVQPDTFIGCIDPVEDWRLERLIIAGYPVDLAVTIATRVDVDLHQAVELVTTRGCTPELAGAILL